METEPLVDHAPQPSVDDAPVEIDPERKRVLEARKANRKLRINQGTSLDAVPQQNINRDENVSQHNDNSSISPNHSKDPFLHSVAPRSPFVVPFPFNLCCETAILSLHRGCWTPLMDSMKSTLCLQMGYKMEQPYRHDRLLESTRKASYYAEDRTADWALSVVIGSIPRLEDRLLELVKPSVKVHVVDIETGHYIRSHHRECAMPLRTKSFTMKSLSSMPFWKEELIFDAQFRDAVSPRSVLLFEILDKRSSVTMNKSSGSKVHFKKVAWGFLFPISSKGVLNVGLLDSWKTDGQTEGANQQNTEELPRDRSSSDDPIKNTLNSDVCSINNVLMRVQLYYYLDHTGIVEYFQRGIQGWSSVDRRLKSSDLVSNPDLAGFEDGYPDGIPSVYLQWRFQKRLPIEGSFLSVSLGPRPIQYARGQTLLRSATSLIGPSTTSNTSLLSSGGNSSALGSSVLASASSKPDDARLRTAVLRRSRAEKEPCVVPNRLLFSLPVGPNGAMVVRFSHSGEYLAVAAESSSSPMATISTSSASLLPTATPYSIIIFHSNTGKEVFTFPNAHYGVIYDLQWSLDDGYLLSVSSDSTIKVWDVAPLWKLEGGPWESSSSSSATVSNRKNESGGVDGNSEEDQIDQENKPNISSSSLNHENKLEGGLHHENSELDTISKPIIATADSPSFPRIPFCCSICVISPPCFIYCGIFWEYSSSSGSNPSGAANTGRKSTKERFASSKNPTMSMKGSSGVQWSQFYSTSPVLGGENSDMKSTFHRIPPPRIICGSSDGHLRVWEGCNGKFLGYIHVEGEDEKKDDVSNDSRHILASQVFPAHEGRIQSIIIDDRSRYLFSGDSLGEVLVWRCDGKGWYQLLRRFRRETMDGSTNPSMDQMNSTTKGNRFMSLLSNVQDSRSRMKMSSTQLGKTSLIGNGNTSSTISSGLSSAMDGMSGVTCLALPPLSQGSYNASHNSSGNSNGTSHFTGTGMNLMLICNYHPIPQLSLYNLSTYRLQSSASGYHPFVPSISNTAKTGPSKSSKTKGSVAGFARPTFSSDGQYFIAGNQSSLAITAVESSLKEDSSSSSSMSSLESSSNQSKYFHLSVWDTRSGAVVRSPLSEYHFPYQIRSISWHPHQHVIAVASVGANAAVAVYCGEKEDIDVAVARMNVEILQNAAMEHSNQLYDKSENEVGISKSTGSTSLPSNKSEDIAMKKQLKSKEIIEKIQKLKSMAKK